MKITITHNAPAIAEAIAKHPETVLPEVDKALFRGSIEVADEIKRQAPKMRSELANSVQIKTKPLEYTIAVMARYAGWVHEGTRPGGVVPLREMLAWMQLKRIEPRDSTMSLTSLAYLLRRRIFQRGIKANPFAARALEAKSSRLTELLESAAERGVRAAMGQP